MIVRVPVRIDCYATGTDQLLASVPAGQALVNPDRRLVGGLAVPWDVPGQPSIGRAVFRPSSVTVPADPSWCKFLIEHDPARSVGYLNQAADTAAGLLAALRVAPGPAGDQVIADILARVRDALSVRVEVDRWNVLPNDQGVEILASVLREISAVAVPAYAPARASVLAGLPTHESESIMAQLRTMLDLTASAPLPAAPAAAPEPPQGPPAPVPAPAAPAPAPPAAAPPAVTAALDPQALAAALAPVLAAALNGPGRPGEPPAGPVAPPARRGLSTVAAAAAEVVRWQSEGTGQLGTLTAALNDVVPASDAGGGSGVGNDNAPQWLGELWTARQSARPYVDALGTPARLTGLKAKGWRWKVRPVVADYTGNKTAVPSNAPTTEPAEADAHRTAGGWDVDRVFLDLGDAAFIQALFAAATEDYAVKSNTWAGAQLVAAAAAADAAGLTATTLLGALGALGAAAGAIGAQVSWLAVAPDVFAAFSALTRDDVPWWMGSADAMDLSTSRGNVGGFRFWADPELDAGTWLAGDRRAATYFEQGTTPIRVQALNVANGGIDLAVFGYNSLIVNDERALWWGDLAPAGG